MREREKERGACERERGEREISVGPGDIIS